MAEKLLNPYSDAHYDTGTLRYFHDRFSNNLLFREGPPTLHPDTFSKRYDFIAEELRRRDAIADDPDNADKINSESNKRVKLMMEGNDYRQRHGLNHFGEKGESWHPFRTRIGGADNDRDLLARGLRKANDFIEEKTKATAEWLGKMADKWKK